MIEEHWSLAEKFLKKWFWLYFFSFITAPIWYIVKIIVSGELDVNEIWIIYGVMSLITLISAFSDFGMRESLNYFIPKYLAEDKYDNVKSILFYAFLVQLITWFIIFFFFLFWSDFLANNYFHHKEASWIIKIFSVFFLWINFFQLINNFFQAVQSTFYQKITEFLRMIFVMFFTIFLFLCDLWNVVTYSYSWIVWLYVWVVISIFVFYLKYYKKYLSWVKLILDKWLFLKTLKYALLVFISAQAWTLLSQVDMQMIIYMLWTEDAWYYTNYLSIITIPFMVIWPIFWLLFPVFSQMYAKWELEKIKLVKHIFQKNFLVVWFAFNILFFVFAREIAYVLFWEKFIESWIILYYSILFLIFNFLMQVNFNIMAAMWRVKERLNIILIALVFNTVLNIVFIKMIWVYGSALATGFWWLLIYILSEIKLKEFKTSFDVKYISKNLTFLVLIWVFMFYAINPLFAWIPRFVAFWFLFLISLIYFWIFLIFNYSEFKFFILEIKRLRR